HTSRAHRALRSFPTRRSSDLDDKALQVFVRHLGLLGPQGALPLSTTEEAYHYALAHDDAFPRFLDLFNHRFIQLFFRAWADARPDRKSTRLNSSHQIISYAVF